MSPVIPHFSSECLNNLNITNLKNTFYWPKINKSILIADKINFVIQINGKTRGILETKADLKEKDILENIRNNQRINNYIKDKSIKNIIFIPNKLMNIII